MRGERSNFFLVPPPNKTTAISHKRILYKMTNAKKSSVCSHCGKRFKNTSSLKQHEAMAHKNITPSSRVPRSRNRRSNRASGVDIAPSRIPPTKGGTIVVSGEDRLAAIDLKAKASVFSSVQISPGASSRLATLSKAYQRIRWNSVRLIVTPQASAMTNGGYVCGFIMDPSDEAVTAKDLTASQGSQTKKWYESAVLNMPSKPDLLYTSPGEDPRLNIPSTFWIISEGAPSSDLTVIVTFHWTVTLSIPTLEDISSSSFSLKGELRGKQSNYNLSYFPPGSTKGQDDFSSQIPDHLRTATQNQFFRVPTFNIEYSEGTGDTGTIQAHFIVYAPGDKKVFYSSNGRTIIETPWQGDVQADQVCVPCGTYCKYIGPGNLCQTVRHPLQPSPLKNRGTSLNEWSQFSQRLLQMERSLQELRSLSELDSQRFEMISVDEPRDLA